MKSHMLFTFLVLLLLSCNTSKLSVEAQNKKIVTQYFEEVWNKGKIDLLDSLLSEDYTNWTPSMPNMPKGPKGLKPIVLKTRKNFKDLHYEIKDMIVTKDKVVTRLVMSGIQTDTVLGIPPTGKKIEVNQINIEYIKHGKITEHWRITDQMKMMKQLKEN